MKVSHLFKTIVSDYFFIFKNKHLKEFAVG